MNQSVKIILDENNICQAEDIARRRNNKPERTNRKFTHNADNYDIHLLGALSEIAWSIYTRWPVDESTRAGGDGGIDFVNNGKTFQIKARDNYRRRLPDMLCRTDYTKADYYILTELNLSEPKIVGLVGWCDKSQLLKSPIINLGYGERYVVLRDELKSLPRKYV